MLRTGTESGTRRARNAKETVVGSNNTSQQPGWAAPTNRQLAMAGSKTTYQGSGPSGDKPRQTAATSKQRGSKAKPKKRQVSTILQTARVQHTRWRARPSPHKTYRKRCSQGDVVPNAIQPNMTKHLGSDKHARTKRPRREKSTNPRGATHERNLSRRRDQHKRAHTGQTRDGRDGSTLICVVAPGQRACPPLNLF